MNFFKQWREGQNDSMKIYLLRVKYDGQTYLKLGHTGRRMTVRENEVKGDIRRKLPTSLNNEQHEISSELVKLTYPAPGNRYASMEEMLVRTMKPARIRVDNRQGWLDFKGSTELVEDSRENMALFDDFFNNVITLKH